MVSLCGKDVFFLLFLQKIDDYLVICKKMCNFAQ